MILKKIKDKLKTKIKTPVKAKAPKAKAKVAAKKTATAVGISFGPTGVQPYQPKKNEEYMNAKQLEHFRKILLNWKEQLMEEVDRTMHHMQDEAANYPDPVDRASQEEEFSLELRARDRERKLLKKIDEALGRIKDNDYGFCDDCGAEIGIRRLEARPTANQCIECKTIAEIREKQIGDGT
jgi:DnaK suppressor protein